MYPGAITNLRIYALSPEQMARTCGPYPFVCRSNGTPWTAFLSEADRDEWLRVRGLKLEGDRVVGEYREHMHGSYDEFYALHGSRIRVLSNGEYTLGIVVADADGLRTVHFLNPNCRERHVFNYTESHALRQMGEHRADSLLQARGLT